MFDGFIKFKVSDSVVPWATSIKAKVVPVGLNEQESKVKNIPHEVTKYDIDDLDRAIADSTAHGFVKVLTVPGKDRILGVTKHGARADQITLTPLALIERINALVPPPCNWSPKSRNSLSQNRALPVVGSRCSRAGQPRMLASPFGRLLPSFWYCR